MTAKHRSWSLMMASLMVGNGVLNESALSLAPRRKADMRSKISSAWSWIEPSTPCGLDADATGPALPLELPFLGDTVLIKELSGLSKLIRRAPKIKLLPEQERLLRLDDEAERKLLAAATECNWRARTLELFQDIVVLVRDTGLRNEKELYQIRIENIHCERHLVFVPDSKTITGIRDVPLSDRALAILRRRCGDRREGWVFPSERAKSGHLTTMAVKFRQARTKAGLPKNLVLYCGRHDFGTRVLKKTGNLKLVMQTMGQKDVKTAMKYQHPEFDVVRTAPNETAPGAPQTGA